MVKKIVAIGGGENGRINSQGIKKPYETKEIDQEIIRLTGKENPNFLFLGHGQISFPIENEIRYIETMKRIYQDLLKCNFRCLTIEELKNDINKAKEDIEWADIIYEGGGDTPSMINLWKQTGFDILLREAWLQGKVMCGVSAGAICWFSCGITDNPEYLNLEINKVDGLGFVDAYLSPHCQKEGKRERVNKSLKHIDKVGISLSNCTAIEIIDNEYKIIKTKPVEEVFEPYVLKSYYQDGKLVEEELNNLDDFKSLNELLSKKSIKTLN